LATKFVKGREASSVFNPFLFLLMIEAKILAIINGFVRSCFLEAHVRDQDEERKKDREKERIRGTYQ